MSNSVTNFRVKWIDRIPNRWNQYRIKNALTLLTDYDANGSFETIAKNVFPNTGEPYAWMVRATDLENKNYGVSELTNYCDKKTYDFLKKSRLASGDLIMAKRGGIGNVYILPKVSTPSTLAPNTYLLRFNSNFNTKYIYYVFKSDFGIEQLKIINKSTTIGAIYKDDVKSIKFIAPPIQEQQIIADFLDDKVGQIDGILSDLNKQIDILNKYKKSLITETVTRGLDPNVKMKDSGIEWIGKIPEGWNVKLIKHISNVHSSVRVYEHEYVTEGIPFFRTKEIVELAQDKDITSELFITKDKYISLKSKSPNKDDILISSIGTIGKVWISDGRDFFYKDGNITQIDNDESFNSKYIKYFIESNCFEESIKYYESTTTISALTIEKIQRIKITFPNKMEQGKIVQYLDEKCSEIDSAISDKQKQIETMEKLKKSLIYEYVTGKKRVGGELKCQEISLESEKTFSSIL